MNSELFFHPHGERGPARAQREARAKAIYQSCAVLEQFRTRTHALTAHEPDGIWGGLSRAEREFITEHEPSLHH